MGVVGVEDDVGAGLVESVPERSKNDSEPRAPEEKRASARR